MTMPNRKLIRPDLAEMKKDVPPRSVRRKQSPPEQTNAEEFYYLKQMAAKTAMVVVLNDGEELRGWIEWYDKGAIKLNRYEGPNLLDPQAQHPVHVQGGGAEAPGQAGHAHRAATHRRRVSPERPSGGLAATGARKPPLRPPGGHGKLEDLRSGRLVATGSSKTSAPAVAAAPRGRGHHDGDPTTAGTRLHSS